MDTGQPISTEAARALEAAARIWPELELLMVFGSAARGRMGERSDVDLFVRLAPGQALDREHEARFVEAASRICRREIDLVVEQPHTSVILRREIAAKGRPLFERRDGAAREFIVDAVRAYVDLEPQLRLIGSAIRARAKREGEAAVRRLGELEARDDQ